jgi:hypothetical protein
MKTNKRVTEKSESNDLAEPIEYLAGILKF